MDRKSFVITISVLLGLNSAIIADHLGVHIPLFRQVFGLVALTFLPGYLLLRIFDPRLESFSENVFFSVALSVSLVMFMGIFANFIYPLLGIEKPITLTPILITFNIVIIVLLFIQQTRARVQLTEKTKLKKIRITKWDLFFLLLPLLSLLSAYWFSFCDDKKGLLVLYLIISLTPLIFIQVKNFNRVFAIWSIALSLLWSTVFGMSWNYIWGYDINGEYYYAKLVLLNGIWEISIFGAANTVASVNVLAPIYSLILNTSLISILKIVYPLLFSLVPLILLKAYEYLLKEKVWAELSVLFFIFLFTFFTEMMALARQMIAEIYLALIIYAIVTKRVNLVFLLVFSISLIVSHYGTAYLSMFALLISYILTYLFKIPEKNKVITRYFVAIFWVVAILWYQGIGGGFQFKNLVWIGRSTWFMLGEIFNVRYSQGLALIVGETTLARELAKWINVLAQGMITLGILVTSLEVIKGKVKSLEFYMLSLVFFGYDVAGLVVPFFANRLNATRLYQITLFFLAPYFIIGFITVLNNIFQKFVNYFSHYAHANNYMLKALAVFISVYFLFNSGFMVEITNDPQPALWLDPVHSPRWSTQEVLCAKWIQNHRTSETVVYLGNFKFPLFLGLGVETKSFGRDVEVFLQKSYVFLGRESVKNGEVESFYFDMGGIPRHEFLSLRNTKLWSQLFEFEKVYANDNTWTYFVSTLSE